MGLIDGLLGKIFGTKAEKDMKSIQPMVNLTLVEYAKLSNLSHDQLRAVTDELRAYVQQAFAGERNELETVRAAIETEENLERKEHLYAEEDKLKKAITEKIEEALTEILPKAFAVVKETARRFTEHETIVVTANDFDRMLAVESDFVTIEGLRRLYIQIQQKELNISSGKVKTGLRC